MVLSLITRIGMRGNDAWEVEAGRIGGEARPASE